MKNNRNVLFLGLDNSGKTTMLNNILTMDGKTKSKFPLKRPRNVSSISPSVVVSTTHISTTKMHYKKLKLYLTVRTELVNKILGLSWTNYVSKIVETSVYRSASSLVLR